MACFLSVHLARPRRHATVLTHKRDAQVSVMHHHLEDGSTAQTLLCRVEDYLRSAAQSKSSPARAWRSYPALVSFNPSRSLHNHAYYNVFSDETPV
jgi:hypothetical protein